MEGILQPDAPGYLVGVADRRCDAAYDLQLSTEHRLFDLSYLSDLGRDDDKREREMGRLEG